MSDIRDLTVKIKGDSSDFERSMGKTASAANTGHASFLKLSGAVAAGQAIFAVASVGIQKIGGFLQDSVKSANESENAVSQLNTVLKSTGSAAGITSKELQDQADSLQRLTMFSDEAVLSAQSLLLTFTNVKGGVFKEAIPVILDMSQALGQDLKSSSIQLGKALNDPIKGITALSRVGVSFTEAQKNQIETLVKSGKTMQAQRIILKELKTEFGGSAEAAGKTFAGSLERLKNQFDSVKESIGGMIVRGITPLSGAVANFLASDKLQIWAEATGKRLKELWEGIKILAERVSTYLQPKLVALSHTLQNDLMPKLEKLWHNVIEPLAPVIGTVLVAAIGFAIDAINAFITAVSAVINWLERHRMAALAVATAFGSLATAMGLQAAFASLTGMITVFTGTTVPSLIVSLKALGVAFLAAFPWAAVVAAGAAAVLTIQKYVQDIKDAINSANEAQKVSTQVAGRADKAAFNKMANDPRYTPEQRAKFAAKVRDLAAQGYASGGFTGTGATNEVAGVVHKGEYVIPKSQVDQSTGTPKGVGGGVNITVNMGMYAGMPVEKRQIALELYKELVRAARAQGVQLPMVGAVGVQ